jgi:hypothetical protein
LYIEETRAPVRDAAGFRRLGRLALVAWAAIVYLVYWLGQLGLR